MIPGAAPVLVYFDNTVACNYCERDGRWCVCCDGTGIMDTLESIEREDVEPVRFLDDAA